MKVKVIVEYFPAKFEAKLNEFYAQENIATTGVHYSTAFDNEDKCMVYSAMIFYYVQDFIKPSTGLGL